MTEADWDSPDWREKLPAWVREDRPMTEAEWLAFPHLYDRIRSLGMQAGTERRLRLFACVCCRRVWHLLQVDAAKRVVEYSEAYADGKVSAAELRAVNDSPDFDDFDALQLSELQPPEAEIQLSACVVAALEAARCLASSSAGISSDVTLIVQNTSYELARDFMRSSRNYKIGFSPGIDEVEFTEKEKLLHDIFGNPFRPAAFSPEWRTDTAVALARQMYESRDFSAMPILADALQDAGCDNEDILNHCRDPKQVHVRGCWVVDLMRGNGFTG
jgi:hypothetical protein